MRRLHAAAATLGPLLLLLGGIEASQRLWRLLRPLLPQISAPWLAHIVIAAVGFCLVVLPLTLAELAFRGSRPPMRSYLVGLAGWLPAWVLGYVVGIATQALVGALGAEPLVIVRVADHAAPVALGLVFLNIFVFDAFYYWFHRMQHAVPLLWRFHAVHHAIRDLNAANSFHHPLEDALRILPIAIPLALLVRFDAVPVIPLASAFIACWGPFIHMSTSISLGPAHYLLSDNRYHRIHHSLAPEHANKNFAAFFPLWDLLFGTANMPKAGEWPDVGLAERPEGPGVRDVIFGVAIERQLSSSPQSQP